MTPISFHVTGEPQPMGRPRAFARRFGNKWQARIHNPATAEGWKGQIALAAQAHVPMPPLLCAVRVTCTLHLPRPKAHYRANGQLKPKAPVYHTSRGDCDNHAKSILDALTQIGLWKDDGQVAALVVEKRYANGAPGADILIEPLGLIDLKPLEDGFQQLLKHFPIPK